MKIKRFEASSMSEALRKIKKEFGEEAVILSAKTTKKSRFLGKKSLKQVVVTAAIDKSSDHLHTKTGESSNRPKEPATQDNELGGASTIVRDDSILKRFSPITNTGKKIIKPKFARLMTEYTDQPSSVSIRKCLIESGLQEDFAAELDQQVRGLIPEHEPKMTDLQYALAQAITARNLVGTRHQSHAEETKCIAMIGPSGMGKTSAVAKMAAKLAMQQPDAVAIISLDNQRVAGTTELERFSKIIGIPFQTAFSVDALQKLMSQFTPYAFIIIDTPGISPNDPLKLEKLRRMIDSIDAVETHLLISACVRESTMARIIDFFKPFNSKSLFFTGLDWATNFGSMMNQAEAHQIPIGHISNSPKITEGFKVVTADTLAGLLLNAQLSEGVMNDEKVTVIKQSCTMPDEYYVANRNSDIFHVQDCKAVKRINTDNMVIFKNVAEAMGQQFKPCRMCCSELIAPKPIDRLAHGYAGHRCY